MSDELNLEAERTAFEAALLTTPARWDTEITVDGEGNEWYLDDTTALAFVGWRMARSIAATTITVSVGQLSEPFTLSADRCPTPISAPLDTQALPPLPDFMRRDIVRAIEEAARPQGMSVHDGKARIGGDRLQRLLLIADQYAERIAHLERELAERKPASIGDDPEFEKLLFTWMGLRRHYQYEEAEPIKAAWRVLIAYIDGRTAGTAPDGYVQVPTKITEAMHVAAVRAIVRATGNDDFPPAVWSAMLAAAPSPLPPKEEAK